mmetsp:Transcript_94370/g.141418  ORF Transcript_94370/g.141418 Transcript_94370/m.141418 type:complete len:115 (+) Transcript_94370:500-844(+)
MLSAISANIIGGLDWFVCGSAASQGVNGFTFSYENTIGCVAKLTRGAARQFAEVQIKPIGLIVAPDNDIDPEVKPKVVRSELLFWLSCSALPPSTKCGRPVIVMTDTHLATVTF